MVDLVGPTAAERRAADELRLAFVEGILQRKYGLYDWTETKLASLVALNGLLLAATYVLSDRKNQWWQELLDPMLDEGWIRVVGLGLAALTVVPLLTSALFCLWHIAPTMNSKLTAEADLVRVPGSVVGMEFFKTTDDVVAKIATMTRDEIIWSHISQIRGMNRNILRNTKAINRAAVLTAAGTAFLVVNFILGS